MAGFSRRLEHDAIGEAELRALSVMLEGGLNDVGVLQYEIAVAEEHLDGPAACVRTGQRLEA